MNSIKYSSLPFVFKQLITVIKFLIILINVCKLFFQYIQTF